MANDNNRDQNKDRSRSTLPDDDGPGYMSVLGLPNASIGSQYKFTRPLTETESQALFAHVVVTMRFFEDRLQEMGIPYTVFMSTNLPGEDNDGPTEEPTGERRVTRSA